MATNAPVQGCSYCEGTAGALGCPHHGPQAATLVNTMDPFGQFPCRSTYAAHDFAVGPTHAVCNRCEKVVVLPKAMV